MQDIVAAVFGAYGAAAWVPSGEVAGFMAGARVRSYCVQYRETDYAFISRLLAEEGLTWRIEEDEDAPARHRLVILADSTDAKATPEDAVSQSGLGGPGIRFHGARSREEQDSIQAIACQRRLTVALTTVLSLDYKAKQSVSASVPTGHNLGGGNAPVLESYDAPGLYAYANRAEAERYARLQQEAHEARHQQWLARSTVRTLRPGTRFSLSQSPLDGVDGAAPDEFVVLEVTSIGVNNIQKPAQVADATLFTPLPDLLKACLTGGDGYGFGGTYPGGGDAPGIASLVLVDAAGDDTGFNTDDPATFADMFDQADSLGYANRFGALAADIPFRPVQDGDDGTTEASHGSGNRGLTGNGLRLNAKPTAHGSQTAIVVGGNGETSASGADEIYCDRLGRVRIKFHWQGQHGDGNATCWVRVAQRSAGGGMGSQFLPRIGQEVQVQFIEGDIDRPIIVGALYHGQGEGGVVPTPGGKSAQQANANVFQPAHDHAPSAQGNLAGGHAPVWHGASGDTPGHRNATALWGIRSKEFGSSGYNQLLIDDTDRQGSVQIKTTQAGTELTLGHLNHYADNFRGSFRGLGAELRTDAYGAVRAGHGILISSYTIDHNASQRDPAGDNAPGMAHLKQATQIAESLNKAAKTHKTVQLAGHVGSLKGNESHIAQASGDGGKPQAPLKAQLTALSGMVSQAQLPEAKADASDKNTSPGANQVPHPTDPLIAIAAKGGLSLTAGQDIQFANGEAVHIVTGQDSQFTTGNQFRVHTGQAIGMLAGAASPGQGNIGLQLIAAQGPIDIQAQSDTIAIQARDDIDVKSSHAHTDWAAAKSITLSTAGGANITIQGGNITVQCPGTITVFAGKKSFVGRRGLLIRSPFYPISL